MRHQLPSWILFEIFLAPFLHMFSFSRDMDLVKGLFTMFWKHILSLTEMLDTYRYTSLNYWFTCDLVYGYRFGLILIILVAGHGICGRSASSLHEWRGCILVTGCIVEGSRSHSYGRNVLGKPLPSSSLLQPLINVYGQCIWTKKDLVVKYLINSLAWRIWLFF